MPVTVFVLLAVVVLAVAAASLTVLWYGKKLEEVRAIATVVSAGAAVAIPIVLYQAAASGRANDGRVAKDTQTLQVMNDLDQRISEIVTRKNELDIHYGVRKELQFSHDYIVTHPDVEDQVRRLLNAYEFICVGVNEALLSPKIVLAMRKDALVKTWDDYRAYMVEKRGKHKANESAWTDCEKFIKEMPKY